MSFRIGADIGGTFTDVVVVEDAPGAPGGGRVRVAKTSTTPRAFSEGVVRALESALTEHGIDVSTVSLLSHATTVVTNAILESKGARVALVTTHGFRDVLELRRSVRGDLYDLFQSAPSVLVPRRHRIEISERLGADGEVVVPLAVDEIPSIIARLREWDVEAVAVTLLFSFMNDAHERALGAALREALPGVPVFLSSEVLPEIREFERTSTTAVCAYVAPILESYLRTLERTVTGMGLPAPYIMGSSGGVLEISEALEMPAMVVESGPAAGVIAGAMAGRQIARPNLITFDMGGTTAKASLIRDGQVETTPEYEVGGDGSGSRYVQGTGHPIRVPVVDLAEVSAGGGSIAWVDPAGALRVGPRSAGAEPGPVCYDRGGVEPTVTDANLLLGRLDATSLLGGDLPIDFSSAERAIAQRVAEPLGLDVQDAAAAVIDIVNNAMAEALRTVSLERGHDPREFSLIAFGGAGPLHAIALAEELEIEEVVIPPAPGAFSAIGLVGTDMKREYVRTWYRRLDQVDASEMQSIYARMESVANAMLERADIAPENRELTRSADVRYVRQAYELNVAIVSECVDGEILESIAADFHHKHDRTYGHANPDEPVQVVTLRVTATGRLGTLTLSHTSAEGPSEKARREVWFKAHGRQLSPVHARDRLALGQILEGPAIVESFDATLVLAPGWRMEVREGDFLFLSRTASTG